MNKWLQQLLVRMVSGMLFGFAFWVTFLFAPPILFSLLLGCIMLTILLFEWRNFFAPTTWQFWLVAPFYPVLPFILLMYLNHMPEYRVLLLLLFSIAFAYDTGSYIVGSLIGEHKIAPQISPGKTWEGFVGGYCIAYCAAATTFIEQCLWVSWPFIAIVTLMACVTLLLGDLFESLLKRNAYIKDSGDLLPGHGGFLDRFDGILLTGSLLFLLKDYLLALLL